MRDRNVVRAMEMMVLVAGSLIAESQSPSRRRVEAGCEPSPTDHPAESFHPKYRPRPNVQVYQKDCLICHSARYVAMQPRFSKTVWQAEVKKMADAYGAPISEADQALIVDYLVTVKGKKAWQLLLRSERRNLVPSHSWESRESRFAASLAPLINSSVCLRFPGSIPQTSLCRTHL